MPVITYPPARRQRATDRERAGGQVLVVFALFLVVLLGAAALSIDYGNWLKARRDYQNVADAAVLAGAGFLTRPLGDSCGTKTKPQCAREAAWASLETQLRLTLDEVALGSLDRVDESVGPYLLTVTSPASAAGTRYPGAAAGSGTVFAFVQAQNPAYFAGLFGQNQETISAWATASSRSGRFAVITLRKIGEDGPNDRNDISINGNGSSLVVKNGDVGGNWGLAISGSGANLTFQSTTGDDYQALLADPRQTAPICCSWNPSQVINGTVDYTAEVPDPNYPLPPGLVLEPPNPSALLPLGDSGGDVDIKKSPPAQKAPGGAAPDPTTGVLTCDADSPRIGPGYYTDINIDSDQCLILDPTVHHTRFRDADTDAPTPVPSTQSPGIFYVRDGITIGAGGMLVGDGVTLVIRPGDGPPGTKLDIKAGAVAAINTGATPGSPARTLGGWYWSSANQTGASPYSYSGGWAYNTGLESNTDNRGIAVYVPRRNQYQTGVAVDDNSDVLNNIEAGAAMVWKGVIYAPHDNVTFAGQVGYDAVGQLVAWTVKFTGNTSVTQEYRGSEQGLPYLIEPKIGQ